MSIIDHKTTGAREGGVLPLSAKIKSTPLIKMHSTKSTKNILVVDDNEDAANSMTMLLRALGYRVSTLYDAADVLPFLGEHDDIDTMLLDVGMPVMDGYKLVRMLREAGYHQQRIIALTGYGLEKDKQKAREAGFDAHLTKPAGIDELREALRVSAPTNT